MTRERYSGIDFENGWHDDIFNSLSLKQQNILVLADQMGVANSSTSVVHLFTKGSHHRNLTTVIYLVINVYNQRNSQRTISLNSHYSVVFCNGQDASQFRTMAYKIYSSDGKWLVDSFTDASFKPYGYLVLDHKPSTPEDQTVVTNLLPGKRLTYYINTYAKVKRH